MTRPRLLLVDAAAIAGSVGQVGEHVGRLQHDLQDVLVGLELVGTNAIKCGLEDVGEGDEVVQAKGAGAALDRMHRAEHRIDGFRIAIAIIHFQETGFQFGELFLALLEKDLFDFVHIHRSKSWALSGYTLDGIDQLGGVEGLDDPAGGTGLAGAVLLFRIAFGGQHQDRDRAVLLVAADTFDEAEAIEARHVDVGDDDIRIGLFENFEALNAVFSLDRLETRIVQRYEKHVSDGAGIVHRQYFFFIAGSPWQADGRY